MENLENEFLGLDFSKNLQDHPLAEKIYNLAKDRGIDLRDYDSLKRIIDQVDTDQLSDPKAVIVIAELIERLINLNNIYIAYNESHSDDNTEDSIKV